MYSLVLGKLQGSLAYVLERAMPDVEEAIDERRDTFLRLFSLYRSLEAFIKSLEKADSELNSLANGGAVVRTVIQNKLNTLRQSAFLLGDGISSSLPNTAGFFSI